LLLPVSFTVDTKPPSAPAVDEPGRVVYSRIPSGSDGTKGREAFCLHGEAGAVEPFATVIVYDGPDPAEARELGRRQAGAGGAFGTATCAEAASGRFELAPADSEVVHVAMADTAGNLSAAAAAVRDVAWTASMGRKVAGSEISNQHKVELRHWWKRRSEPEDAVEVAATETVLAREGAVVRADARPGWRQAGPTTGAHPSVTPGALAWTTRDPLQLARLPVGERKEISFALASPDVPGAGRAAVVVDQAEVLVRYRLPAP